MITLYKGISQRWRSIIILIIAFTSLYINVNAQQGGTEKKGTLRIKVTEEFARRIQQSATQGRVSANTVNPVLTGIPKLNEVNVSLKITSMKRVFPDAGRFEAKHRKHGLHLWYEVEMDETVSIENARSAYNRIPEIQLTEPVHPKASIDKGKVRYSLLSSGNIKNREQPNFVSEVTNDPYLKYQWHYDNRGQFGGKIGADINLLKAWRIEAGRAEVVVAINDGGVETTHPDLADNIWTNEDEIPANGIDDDNNGFVDDIHGFSFVDWRGTIKPHPHGTHVAGTIAAVNNNGVGVSGIAGGTGSGDGVRLMSCAVFKEIVDGVDIYDGYENAFVYAADNGAVISQNSWGYDAPGVYEQVVLDAIDYFIAEAGQDENGNQVGPMRGGIVIFAAGNDGMSGDRYPARYEPVLAVAATTQHDTKAYYSNYADWVDIAAPGGEDLAVEDGVLSTFTGGEYAFAAGTSMACPHVSGVSALIISHFGGDNFSTYRLRDLLLTSSDNIDSFNPSYLGMLGAGRVNVFKALSDDADETGPHAISDLSITAVTNLSLTLQWTAPADEGSTSASYYEMRYSTSPITMENFSSATPVREMPKTGPAGTTDSFVLKGLEPNTEYFVAIVSYDKDFANASPLSNVAIATTSVSPVIAVTPSRVVVDMQPGNSVAKEVYISNTGEGDLQYRIEPNEGQLENWMEILTFSKRTGTILPGEKDTVVLTFSPFVNKFVTSLEEVFLITSNDPQHVSTELAVQLNVIAKGTVVADVSELNFGVVTAGVTVVKTVPVKNVGAAAVYLSNAKVDNNNFTIIPFDTVLYETPSPGGKRDISVLFHPSAAGTVSGTMTIETTDPENPVITVVLSGSGDAVPALSVSAPALTASLKSDEQVSRQLTLTNSGQGNLIFDMLEMGPILQPRKVVVLSPDGSGSAMPYFMSGFPEITIDIKRRMTGLSAKDLIPYDVVIVMNNEEWSFYGGISPLELGNVLADYIDAGGKVIINMMALDNSSLFKGMEGRFITDYSPFMTLGHTNYSANSNLGEIVIPNHPLLKDVKAIYNGGIMHEGLTLNGNAAGISKWSNGEWMLAATPSVVAINAMTFGENTNTLLVEGDLPVLYQNAVRWLTGSTHMDVQPDRGVIAPGESVQLDITVNARKLPSGTYNTALAIAANIPGMRQTIVPFTWQVEGPSVRIAPEEVNLTLDEGHKATETITLQNSGTSAVPYKINVQHKRIAPLIAVEAGTTTQFATTFEQEPYGIFPGNGSGWSLRGIGTWSLDTTSAASGRKHLKYAPGGATDYSLVLISPVIESGTGKSMCSMNIKMEGGLSFQVVPLSYPVEAPVTTIQFKDGGIWIENYHPDEETFTMEYIREPLPNGYFNLAVDVDRTTSVMNVYINDKIIFTGIASVTTINAVAMVAQGNSKEQRIWVDDVVVSHGGFSATQAFLSVTPDKGTLSAGETLELKATADASELPPGRYYAEVVADILEGTDQVTLPVYVTVTGRSTMNITSTDKLSTVVDYHEAAVKSFEISNTGGEPFVFNINVPEAARSWLKVEPSSGTVGPNELLVVNVVLSSKDVGAGNFTSEIEITSDAYNLKSKTASVSMDVREPAKMAFGPGLIIVEVARGFQTQVPLTFTNIGSSNLHVVFEPTNNWLHVSNDTLDILPDQQQVQVSIRISAINQRVGIVNDTLVFYTNDPENVLVRVPVQLNVIDAPKINLSLDALNVTLKPGETASNTLEFKNTGDARLRYMVADRHMNTSSTYHGGPDAYGYTFIDSRQSGGPAFVWNDISATGISVALGDDDTVAVDLPFEFNFYGEMQNEVKICSNGFLTFRTPKHIIAAHRDDLDPRKIGAIYYKKEADKFIVQFTDISRFNFGPVDENLLNTFQIVLHIDGSIEFHYLDIMTNVFQVVGIESPAVLSGLSIKNGGDNSFSADSTSLLITPTVSWVSTPFQEGSLTANQGESLTLNFDAADLEEGIYHTMLYITSNDQSSPIIHLPIKLNVTDGSVTAVEDPAMEKSWSIYPVPAKDHINLRRTGEMMKSATVTILNVQGKVVLKQEVEWNQTADYRIPLNSTPISPGLYILQLTGQGWQTAKVFVKE